MSLFNTLNGFISAAVEVLGKFNLTTAVFDNKSFSYNAQSDNAQSIFFSTDGTKCYVLGDVTPKLFQYTLSTPWDLSTAIFASKTLNVDDQDSTPAAIYFRSDGTRMFMGGATSDTVYQYTLSTPFDISTASFDSISFDVTGGGGAADLFYIFFSFNGDRLYVLNANSTIDTIFQYNLSTNFDITTASFASKTFFVGTQDSDPQSFFITNDDKTMYMLGTTTNTVYQYTLSTPGDISTAVFDNISFSVASENVNPASMFFRPTGENMFVMGVNPDTVFQYSD